MNSIILTGRTTSNIELKTTNSGKSVTSFSLAVKRPFAKDTTDFFSVTAWDKMAEMLAKYCIKGTKICIRGHLTTRNWEDVNGGKRYATEIVVQEFEFCESKKNSETNSAPAEEIPTQGNVGGYTSGDFEVIDDDLGLPF